MNAREITLQVRDRFSGKIIYFREVITWDQLEQCIEDAKESWDAYQDKLEETLKD